MNDTGKRPEIKASKQQRIEKLDFQKVQHQGLPYTQLLNKVIQNIKDPEAFMVWAYLSSLPSDWLVNKEHIKNKFAFGDRKIRSIFSYLFRSKLITYVQERNSDGTVGKSVIHVFCGDNFDMEEPFLAVEAKTAPTVIIPKNEEILQKSPLRQKTAPTVNRTGGSEALQKKHNNKDFKKTKKTKSFYENEKKHLWAESKNQMANEKRHIDEHEKRKKEEIEQARKKGKIEENT